MAKGKESTTFEIVVVLAIVAIVAVTGQVLIFYQGEDSYSSVITGNAISGNAISGFAISEESNSQRHDLSVQRIEVNPGSPLIGDPFEVIIYMRNNGDEDITVPFILEAFIDPNAQDITAGEKMRLSAMSSKILAPGEETSIEFLVTTIMPEGPVRITASADPTGKLQDDNPANNLLSKTIIVATE